MQWSKLHNLKRTRLARVLRIPGSATIRIGEIGIEDDEFSSLSQKIQCAIWSRSGACQLAMRLGSGFGCLHSNRTEPKKAIYVWGKLQSDQLQHSLDFADFFYVESFAFGTHMSHF